MGTITTEAWFLHQGPQGVTEMPSSVLQKEAYSFPAITEQEVLAEPLYGCWEGNMTHALTRNPIDICRQRGEEKVIIGNAGVVRVLNVGSAVRNMKEGDFGLFFFGGTYDRRGYSVKIAGYDAPHTVGMMAKRIKLPEHQIIPLPKNTQYSLQQWAAFSLRYVTAWSNWKVAYGSWLLQIPKQDVTPPWVWGWGGGVTLAELTLAQLFHCQVAMLASKDSRLKVIRDQGIHAIDRRQFPSLFYDEQKYESNPLYKKQYQVNERLFLQKVDEYTHGDGVSIFIDNIGLPVFRATLKALSSEGVLTTVGWKMGMSLQLVRAIECIHRHTHVHTHGSSYEEAAEGVLFAEEHGWLPQIDTEIYKWDDIPTLAEDYENDVIDSYFPIYQINPE